MSGFGIRILAHPSLILPDLPDNFRSVASLATELLSAREVFVFVCCIPVGAVAGKEGMHYPVA